MSQVKRTVPAPIKKILQADIEITKHFNSVVDKIVPLQNFKTSFKALEISCYGIPWLAFWVSFTWLFNDQTLVQMNVNILIGLILDIIFVAIVKAYARRQRPSASDKEKPSYFKNAFGFPSGHASRSVFVAYFFMNLHPLPIVCSVFVIIWATSVCITRILSKQHYILDVIAGVVLGLFTGILLGLIYVPESTAHWIMNALSDEKLDGGEFHV